MLPDRPNKKMAVDMPCPEDKGEAPSGLMDTNPADQVFFPEMYTRFKSYYDDEEGDSTAQSLAVKHRPNGYMQLVNGGTINSLAPTGTRGDDGIYTPHADNLDAVWFYEEVEDVLSDQLFTELQHQVRRRIVYSSEHVRIYMIALAHLIADYTALRSWFDQLLRTIGTLGEIQDMVPDFFVNMFNRFDGGTTDRELSTTLRDSSIITETKAWFEMIESTISMFAFPEAWQKDIEWVYTVHRLGPFDDSPIAGFVPYQRDNFTEDTDLADRTKSTGGPVSIWQKLQLFSKVNFNKKISADLMNAMGWSGINLTTSYGEPAWDNAWYDLWTQNGFLHDDRNVTPNDSIVPNASDAKEGKRYSIPYDFSGLPTDLFLTNACWGLGDQLDGVRGRHLANIVNVKDRDGDLDASNQALACYGFVGKDHDSDPKPRIVSQSLALSPGAALASPKTLLDAFNATKSLAESIALGARYSNGNLGWRRVFQVVNSTATDDSLEGFTMEQPIVGRRFYAEPFNIQMHALNRYRELWGVV